jgi:hypothetical protein
VFGADSRSRGGLLIEKNGLSSQQKRTIVKMVVTTEVHRGRILKGRYSETKPGITMAYTTSNAIPRIGENDTRRRPLRTKRLDRAASILVRSSQQEPPPAQWFQVFSAWLAALHLARFSVLGGDASSVSIPAACRACRSLISYSTST